jgi:NACalpha-BTF3-like transcription factor
MYKDPVSTEGDMLASPSGVKGIIESEYIIDDKDVELPVQQIGCTTEIATNALRKYKGDLVNAMTSLVPMSTMPADSEDVEDVNGRDLDLVIQQTSCSNELATSMLKKYGGDVVDAIIELTDMGFYTMRDTSLGAYTSNYDRKTIHPHHTGFICPIVETPETPNIGQFRETQFCVW